MRDHPEIECAMNTGYPSWMLPAKPEPDEDELYEAWRDDNMMERMNNA